MTATSATTVTLTGTVNPNGTATTWDFQYGTTTAYGSTATVTSAGAGSTSTGVSADVTGLTPGTQYHYRLDAMSTAGTTDGADGIFTTSAASPVPTVTTSAATSVTSSQATLNGSLNPNGQATTYDFEYGKSTSYGSTTGVQNGGSGTTSVAVSAAITGLTAEDDVPLPPRRDERHRRDGRRLDMTFTAGGASAAGADCVTTKASDLGHLDGGEAERNRQPERPGDDLLLRVRHDDELRLEDLRRQRRVRHEGRLRLGDLDRPEARDLPLPSRGDELRRHLRRQRPDLREHRPAGRPDRHGAGRLHRAAPTL